MRLGFSHLGEHTFRDHFTDIVNLLSPCYLWIESTRHFLRSQNYITFCKFLMNEWNSTNGVLVTLTTDDLVRTIRYGDKKLNNDFNFNSNILFLTFFVVFHHKIRVFIIFSSFFDEVSNFRNRILTYQKRELVVSNCQWNCIYVYNKATIYLDDWSYQKISCRRQGLLSQWKYNSCTKFFIKTTGQ